MNTRRILYLTALGAMLAVYAAMVFWTVPAITREANGLLPFDLRPGGYSFSEAQAFLRALSDAGRAIYLGPQRTLDLVYPALLATVLVWSIRAQAQAIGQRLARGLQVLGMVAAGLGMVSDYMENHAVTQMLRMGDNADRAMAAAASGWTVAKSAATSIAMLVLLALLAWRLQRRPSAG